MMRMKILMISAALLFAGQVQSQTPKDMVLAEEVEVMKAHVKALGEDVDTGELVVPMAVYLLQNDKEALAVKLVEQKVITPFVTANIDNATISDYQIAITYGFTDYYRTLLDVAPNKINDPLIISQEGDKLPLLSLLALSKDTKSKHYEAMVRMTINAGGLPKQSDLLGLSPFSIASNYDNQDFIDIVIDLEQQAVKGEGKNFLVNPPLSSIQLIEEQSMIDAYLEVSATEDVQQFVMVEQWFNAVMRGYNTLAEVYYQALLNTDAFSIDIKNKKGLTALQATALSSVYGGNVSYAKKLLERGADIHQIVVIGQGENAIKAGLIDLALSNDNHKVIALYITNNIDFLHSPGDANSALIVQALQQEAYKSSVILKAALDRLKREMANQ